MDPLVYTERDSSAEDPMAMQLQIKMQCTWANIKNSMEQNNLNYGYSYGRKYPYLINTLVV